jgi:hypothetical protein
VDFRLLSVTESMKRPAYPGEFVCRLDDQGRAKRRKVAPVPHTQAQVAYRARRKGRDTAAVDDANEREMLAIAADGLNHFYYVTNG